MDVNVQAFHVMKQATETNELAEEVRREASRRGGTRGGIARALSLPPERQREIAQKANAARWQQADR